MKTCTPCNLSYPDEKKFCKSCGRILTPGATLHSNATVQPSLSALKTKGAKMQSAGKALKIVLISLGSLIFIVLAIVLTLYFIQKNAWDTARKQNTLISYQNYLEKYPDGKYSDEAHNIIRDKNDSVTAVHLAIQDSIANAQKEMAFQDSIASVEKARQDSFTDNQNPLQTLANKISSLVIKGTRVNIRSYPSLQSGVLIQLNTGDICRILEKSELVNVNGTNDYWYKINCNGNVGWVFGAFTTLILNDPASNSSANSNNQTAIAIINRVFFYSSPNINTKTSLYIVKNQSVEIITNNGDFWGVTFTYNNKTTSGYMLKNELRL